MIPLLEVVCKIGTDASPQIGVIVLNVGVIVVTLIVIFTIGAHCPAVGVNV